MHRPNPLLRLSATQSKCTSRRGHVGRGLGGGAVWLLLHTHALDGSIFPFFVGVVRNPFLDPIRGDMAHKQRAETITHKVVLATWLPGRYIRYSNHARLQPFAKKSWGVAPERPRWRRRRPETCLF